MIKILFMIPNLGQGGAEKVLVNLVNNMDTSKFDVTVRTLFDYGVNRQYLKPHIRYVSCFKKVFPGNSHILKILTPQMLHRIFIREHYDIEVAYLEGPCARVIAGGKDRNTKSVAWIHCKLDNAKCASASFRSINEAKRCYGSFDKIVSVSEAVQEFFQKSLKVPVSHQVLYNTNESSMILKQSMEPVEDESFLKKEIKIVAVGKLVEVKGFDRLLRIVLRLRSQGYPIHLYILGIGQQREQLETYTNKTGISTAVTFLGYQTNPYKYVARCDLFVCSSYSEGFSTATTEALIVGTPVCTVDVSGMKEMLGENSEYGMIVPNDENSLYLGIKKLLDEPELLNYYRAKAAERGAFFSTEKTVKAVEDMLLNL